MSFDTLVSFALFLGALLLMMRFGCGAHVSHALGRHSSTGRSGRRRSGWVEFRQGRRCGRRFPERRDRQSVRRWRSAERGPARGSPARLLLRHVTQDAKDE
jgi:hypothetical protein